MNPRNTDNLVPQTPPAPYGPPSAVPGYSPVTSVPPTPAASQPPEPAPQPDQKHHDHDGWRSIISTLLLFLLAPVIALTIAAFVIQSYQVDGQSMETTLKHQDRLIVDKLPRTWSRLTNNPYIPNRGDIIIFNQSDIPNASVVQNKQLIKRVVALPGERIVIKDGKIKVFNHASPKGFDPDASTGYLITSVVTPGNVDLTVPEGEVFVCGDNRQNSEDSRFFGPVAADQIVGKLVLRLLPLDKLQTF